MVMKHNPLIAAMGMARVAGCESLDPSTDTIEELPAVVEPTEEEKALVEAEEQVEAATAELDATIQAEVNYQDQVAKAEHAITGLEAMFTGDFDEAVYREHVGTLKAISETTEVPLTVTVDGMESLNSAQIYLNTMGGLESFMDGLKAVGKTIKELVIKAYNTLLDLLRSFKNLFLGLNAKLANTKSRLDAVDEIKPKAKLGKWNKYLGAEHFSPAEIRSMKILTELMVKVSKVKIRDMGSMDDTARKKSIDELAYLIADVNGFIQSKDVDRAANKEVYYMRIGNTEFEYTIPMRSLPVDSLLSFGFDLKFTKTTKDSGEVKVYLDKRHMADDLDETIEFAKHARDTFDELDKVLKQERDSLVAAVHDPKVMDRTMLLEAIKIKRSLIEKTERSIFHILEAKNSLFSAHL